MSITQTFSKDTFRNEKIYLGSMDQNDYLWKNLKIEMFGSKNWLFKLYKGSVFDTLWRLVTSPVD